jgi:hypothetical protein
MRGWLFRSLGKLYPKAWRDRYGGEVDDLSDELLAAGEVTRPRLVIELLCSGLSERLRSWHRARFVLVSGAVALVVLLTLALSLGGVFQGRPSTSPISTCGTARHVKVTGIKEVPSPTLTVKVVPAKLLPLPGSSTVRHAPFKVAKVEPVQSPRLTVKAVPVITMPMGCSKTISTRT